MDAARKKREMRLLNKCDSTFTKQTNTHTNVNSLGGSDLISDDPMLMTKKQADPRQPPQWDGPRMENDNASI